MFFIHSFVIPKIVPTISWVHLGTKNIAVSKVDEIFPLMAFTSPWGRKTVNK